MAASYEDIAGWLAEAKKKDNVTHVIIATDTFDWEDFPVEVTGGSTACQTEIDQLTRSHHKVMEVYDLRRDVKEQLSEHRAWHV